MLNQALDKPLADEPSEPGLIAREKKALRTQIRKQRKALTLRQQKLATRNLLRQLNKSRILLRYTHIALYLGNDGELNPEALIPHLWARKKKVYLPVIHPLISHKLCFCEFNARTKLQTNHFGIREPEFSLSKRLRRQFLSVVFLPLVAFDIEGNRMGMGGGFYDRSFAYKHHKANSKPRLIGLAHAFQEQPSLPTESWDIPLDGILTDKQFYRLRIL